MKIVITEHQIKNLSDNIIYEQEYGGFLGSLYGNNVADDTKGNNTNFDFVNVTGFDDIVKLIVEKIEGGYFHPNMLNDGRVKDRRYRRSGETMFGIDRKRGGKINTSAAGVQFWSIIDNANARHTWSWNYDGGEYKTKLISLVAQMIKPIYDEYSRKYLSPVANKIINNDKRLLLNFVYATWNGEGWFKKFASNINNAILSGNVSVNQLVNVAIDSRAKSGSSLIAQSGNKISGLMSQMS